MNADDDWIAPLFELPLRLHPETPWWNGHIPFLFLLFKLAQPHSCVELGVLRGTSFLAACQAAKRFATGTKCYGIDTWLGDDHAGYYQGDAMYEELRRFTADRFAACELIRSTFEAALRRFQDKSVDLLHIDGQHSYEDVSRDFQTWLPKLSDRSIVMLHDTEVRERNFGVWRFWLETKLRYRHLEFRHSYGLGVLFTGRAPPEDLDHLLQRLQSRHGGAELLQIVCEAAASILPLRMQRRDIASGSAFPRCEQLVPAQTEMRRNAPCPCGSGKRYKHCHGQFS